MLHLTALRRAYDPQEFLPSTTNMLDVLKRKVMPSKLVVEPWLLNPGLFQVRKHEPNLDKETSWHSI